jgi:hypothetical protein
MKNLQSYKQFIEDPSMNEANISFYKSLVQNAIKDALGQNVKQSDIKVGSKKQSGGYDLITLNDVVLAASDKNYVDILRLASDAIKEDPAKYGLKESEMNEAKGPDWNRKDFDGKYWGEFIDTAKKSGIKHVSDLLKLIDKKLPSISGAEWDEALKILKINESSVNEASVQVAGKSKPSGAKVLATVIVEHMMKENYLKPGAESVKNDLISDIADVIMNSTF